MDDVGGRGFELAALSFLEFDPPVGVGVACLSGFEPLALGIGIAHGLDQAHVGSVFVGHVDDHSTLVAGLECAAYGDRRARIEEVSYPTAGFVVGSFVHLGRAEAGGVWRPDPSGLADAGDVLANRIDRDDVWFGARTIVLPGVRTGIGSIVGAGRVVSQDTPDRVVAVGALARPSWDR